MCYYIGIEDLAANALIEILQAKNGKDSRNFRVTLRDLETYGEAVVKYFNKNSYEKAQLVLSRAYTSNMFRNYSDFFEEIDLGSETAIALQSGKTVEDLVNKFRVYNASDLNGAFEATAEAVVNAAS